MPLLQSGYIYIFELPEASPSASSDGNLQAQQLLCSGLGESSPHWRMRPVSVVKSAHACLLALFVGWMLGMLGP